MPPANMQNAYFDSLFKAYWGDRIMKPLRERIATAAFGGFGVFFALRALALPNARLPHEVRFPLVMSAESVALAPSVLFARVSLFRLADNPALVRHGMAAVLGVLGQVLFLLALVAWFAFSTQQPLPRPLFAWV